MFPLCVCYKREKWKQSCNADLKCALGVLSRCSYYGALSSAFQSTEECVTERWTFAPSIKVLYNPSELIVFIKAAWRQNQVLSGKCLSQRHGALLTRKTSMPQQPTKSQRWIYKYTMCLKVVIKLHEVFSVRKKQLSHCRYVRPKCNAQWTPSPNVTHSKPESRRQNLMLDHFKNNHTWCHEVEISSDTWIYRDH